MTAYTCGGEPVQVYVEEYLSPLVYLSKTSKGGLTVPTRISDIKVNAFFHSASVAIRTSEV